MENFRGIQYCHISDAAIFAHGCRLMNTQHSVCGFEDGCLLHMAYAAHLGNQSFQ